MDQPTFFRVPSPSGFPDIWPLEFCNILELQSRKGQFSQCSASLESMAVGSSRDASAVEESNISEQSGGGGRKRRNAMPAALEDETSKLVSSCSRNEFLADSNDKHLKIVAARTENSDYSSSVNSNCEHNNDRPPEAPKQDYIHVRTRRGQATDSHSLAERARREKISERMKILQDLVPGCNKVIGKALVLDEIINYIHSLQRQVEFLSMKIEAVNSRMSSGMEGFPTKDFCLQPLDSAAMIFAPHATRVFDQDSKQNGSICRLGVVLIAHNFHLLGSSSLYHPW